MVFLATSFLAGGVSAQGVLDQQALLGKWCFSHTEIAGSVDKENIPYEFFDNGEFSFKNSATASSTRKANYSVDGDKLDIGGLAPGGLKVVELTDSVMIAEGMFSSKRHFYRGDCN